MDGLDDGPDLLADDPSATTASSNNKNLRGETVDLNPASSDLMVDISDALSERDKVKFTVHTKVTSKRNRVRMEVIMKVITV